MSTLPGRAEILERLKLVIPDKIDVNPDQLVTGARLGDIGIDSFALIELVFVAEEEFGIKIPVDGLKVTTVDDVLDVIERCGRASIP